VKSGETYELGLRFLELGTFVKNDIRLASVAKPSLEKLAEETGEAVWLIVEEHGCGVYLDNAIGENGFQIETDVGERSYLHYSAAGKALLAHRPRTEVREIIDRRGLPTRTEHTISDPDELLDELDRIRERGFAFNEEEEIIGVHGVGAPICDDEYAIGAIGVGGAANRLNGECFRRELPDLLLGATNEIELRLTYS
jgi:DNA-binding IclR family transcriptional regulator